MQAPNVSFGHSINAKVLEKINLEAQESYNSFIAGSQPSNQKNSSLFSKYITREKVEQYMKDGGGLAGRKAAETFGPSASNTAIDCVMRFWFGSTPEPTSLYQRATQFFKGATQNTVITGAQMGITPFIAPALTALGGAAGSVALPLVITLVQLAWNKAMQGKSQQLTLPSMDDVLNPNAKSGLVFDELNQILSGMQRKQLTQLLTELDLTTQLLSKKPEEVEDFIRSYLIYRTDEKVCFMDGQEVKEEEHAKIQEGIAVLKEGSAVSKEAEIVIRDLVRVISSHNNLPLKYLSALESGEIVDLVASIEKKYSEAKRMPPLFEGEDHEWKNLIIQCKDGVYCIGQTSTGVLKGTVVAPERMKQIFTELEVKEKAANKKKLEDLKTMLNPDPKVKDQMVSHLLSLDNASIKQVFNDLIINRHDGKAITQDGQLIDPKEAASLRNAFDLPAVKGFGANHATRMEKVKFLVDFFSSRLPASRTEAWQSEVIKCKDGVYCLMDGTIISEAAMNEIITAIKAAAPKK